MEQGERSDKRNIIKTLLVYLGGAWVFIEAINFLIDKYDDFVMSFYVPPGPPKKFQGIPPSMDRTQKLVFTLVFPLCLADRRYRKGATWPSACPK